ncbi:uncharacterized protein [Linepithema humile]|uniref:uncharacterized protein isoform X2 n=1 Tax=Linepithema humile TaxID=83485 RepID=UPI00351E8942
MDSTRATNFRRDEEPRSVRNEDHNSHSISRTTRTEEEKQRRRQEWLRQQERERQHEKLKQQKILEYERKRAQSLKHAQTLKHSEQKPSRHSRSRSDSKSPSLHRHRGRSTSNVSKSGTLYEKLDGSSSGAVPLFKDAQGIQISTTELRRIKVDIRRNIPAKGSISELERDILNPEDVVVKRREREGCKPIFDREEIKTAIVKPNEVEERRTVVAVDRDQPVSSSKLRTSTKRSSSLSPTRNRGYSPGYLSSYQSKRDSVEKRREHKERYTDREAKYDTNRSRSRERDPCTSNSRSFMDDRTYRDRSRRDRSRRERSSERSRDKRDRDRDRSREPRDVTPYYIEPVHVPIYYGSFPPRPIVVSPMVPFRGQVPSMGRSRHPGLMAPVRPFSPRFIPPDMYRLGPPPPNPRYGPY